jgi:hypothetical protein
MVLYTVIPYEIIFASNTSQKPEYEEFMYMGEIIQARPDNNNRYVIHRLISTSLKSYLNPLFSPGTVVSSHHLNKAGY